MKDLPLSTTLNPEKIIKFNKDLQIEWPSFNSLNNLGNIDKVKICMTMNGSLQIFHYSQDSNSFILKNEINKSNKEEYNETISLLKTMLPEQFSCYQLGENIIESNIKKHQIDQANVRFIKFIAKAVIVGAVGIAALYSYNNFFNENNTAKFSDIFSTFISEKFLQNLAPIFSSLILEKTQILNKNQAALLAISSLLISGSSGQNIVDLQNDIKNLNAQIKNLNTSLTQRDSLIDEFQITNDKLVAKNSKLYSAIAGLSVSTSVFLSLLVLSCVLRGVNLRDPITENLQRARREINSIFGNRTQVTNVRANNNQQNQQNNITNISDITTNNNISNSNSSNNLENSTLSQWSNNPLTKAFIPESVLSLITSLSSAKNINTADYRMLKVNLHNFIIGEKPLEELEKYAKNNKISDERLENYIDSHSKSLLEKKVYFLLKNLGNDPIYLQSKEMKEYLGKNHFNHDQTIEESLAVLASNDNILDLKEYILDIRKENLKETNGKRRVMNVIKEENHSFSSASSGEESEYLKHYSSSSNQGEPYNPSEYDIENPKIKERSKSPAVNPLSKGAEKAFFDLRQNSNNI